MLLMKQLGFDVNGNVVEFDVPVPMGYVPEAADVDFDEVDNYDYDDVGVF